MEKLVFGGAFLWLFAMSVLLILMSWQLAVGLFVVLVTVIAWFLAIIWVLRTFDS